MKPTAIDLFCGAGGFTTGFKKAGYRIVFANDNWETALSTYAFNHKDVVVSDRDIRHLEVDEIIEKSRTDSIDVIIGSPPCQGFSMAGKRRRDDKRNELWREFFRVVNGLKPKIIVMENVYGILAAHEHDGSKTIEKIQRTFDIIGYKLSVHILNAADFGVPQMRNRAIMIANNLGIENGHLFPKPTHGPGLKKYATVGETIMDIARKQDPYDRWNHRKMNHTERLVKKLKKIPEGRVMEKEHYRFVYRRLRRRSPACTLVPGHSAFPVHPTQHRSITVREAARLQTFPDSYRFFGTHCQQCLQVGNAIPPLLAENIAVSIKRRAFIDKITAAA